ncbi:hypothetical protein ACRAWD_26300 [Caulobacter segnis]
MIHQPLRGCAVDHGRSVGRGEGPASRPPRRPKTITRRPPDGNLAAATRHAAEAPAVRRHARRAGLFDPALSCRQLLSPRTQARLAPPEGRKAFRALPSTHLRAVVEAAEELQLLARFVIIPAADAPRAGTAGKRQRMPRSRISALRACPG